MDDSDEILSWYVRQYQSTGNPFYAANGFLLATDLGREPPTALSQWVARGLRAWIQSEGQADIGKALGLAPGRGQAPAHKRMARERRDARLLHCMDFLMHLGATRMEAAQLAIGRHGLDDVLSVDTVVSMHARDHRDGTPVSHMARLASEPGYVAQYLAKFDADSMNAKLKSML